MREREGAEDTPSEGGRPYDDDQPPGQVAPNGKGTRMKTTQSEWATQQTRPLRVAMIGQKGLPATFGGIEHHVERLGELLAASGEVEVTVYCRRSYGRKGASAYRGMRLVTTPTVATKHLDAIVHSFTSTLHAMRNEADIVHYHALGPGLAAPLPKLLSRAKVVLTVHGLDHERAKWKGLASSVLGVAHWLSGHVPDAVVTVSRSLAEHYRVRFGVDASYIPNGVRPPQPGPLPERFALEHGLRPGGYVLFVGRVVPEKRPDLLLEAMAEVPGDLRIAVVGDSSFSDEYVRELRAMATRDPRVVFPGYVFGAELGALYSNAALFVQPSDLEGLPLTLLEALSYDVPVVASDIPPHREILGDCGCNGHRLFAARDAAALSEAIRDLLKGRATMAEQVASDARRLLEPYSWDKAQRDLYTVYARLVS